MEEVTIPYAPKSIIIDSQDLVAEFRFQICSVVSDRDFKEVITQVIQMLLNEENGCLDAMNRLPEFNRMTDDAYSEDSQLVERIQKSTSEFGYALYQRLRSLGVYHGNTLPYFFDQLLGNDLVLSHLPY